MKKLYIIFLFVFLLSISLIFFILKSDNLSINSTIMNKYKTLYRNFLNKKIIGSKIAVCMWYNDPIKNYADIAAKINQKYCDKKDYDLIISHDRMLPDRHPSWECIPLILFTMLSGNYKYVMWIDSDACFNDKSTNSLENLIKNNPDKHIIFSNDIKNAMYDINFGVFLVKTSDYSIKLFKNLMIAKTKICKNHYNKWVWEQACINNFYDNDNNKLKKHSNIIPFGIFQTFEEKDHPNAIVFHYAGKSSEYRQKILSKNYLELQN